MAGPVPHCSRTDQRLVRRHAGDDARTGIESGAMTPWLVHGPLRNNGLEVVCLDARHARAGLEMQINKTDRTTLRDWLRMFAPGGPGLFMSNRLEATGAGSSRGKDSTHRHDDPIVLPHPGRPQDLRFSARRDAGIAFRSEC
jgi:hypothetical protein